MLALAVVRQLLQMVGGRRPEVIELDGLVYLVEFSSGELPPSARTPWSLPGFVDTELRSWRSARVVFEVYG
jgi:hypothetical protein